MGSGQPCVLRSVHSALLRNRQATRVRVVMVPSPVALNWADGSHHPRNKAGLLRAMAGRLEPARPCRDVPQPVEQTAPSGRTLGEATG